VVRGRQGGVRDRPRAEVQRPADQGRQHLAPPLLDRRRGPDYFIKDLGSTNGVEFEGTRVDNHKIVEGSVYFLCDHELRFSFTPPGSTG
jgi:hypothetical protein